MEEASAGRRFIRLPLHAAFIVRVAAACCGVAVLVLAAALFAQHRPTAATPTSDRDQTPQTGEIRWVSPSVAEETAAVSATLGALDRATEARVRSSSRRTNAAFDEAGASFDRKMRAYLAAARRGGYLGRRCAS